MYRLSNTLIISLLSLFNIVIGICFTALLFISYGTNLQAQLFMAFGVLTGTMGKLLQGGFLQEITLPRIIDLNKKNVQNHNSLSVAVFAICISIGVVTVLFVSFISEIFIYTTLSDALLDKTVIIRLSYFVSATLFIQFINFYLRLMSISQSKFLYTETFDSLSKVSPLISFLLLEEYLGIYSLFLGSFLTEAIRFVAHARQLANLLIGWEIRQVITEYNRLLKQLVLNSYYTVTMLVFSWLLNIVLGQIGGATFAAFKYAERIYWAFEITLTKPLSVMLLTRIKRESGKDHSTIRDIYEDEIYRNNYLIYLSFIIVGSLLVSGDVILRSFGGTLHEFVDVLYYFSFLMPISIFSAQNIVYRKVSAVSGYVGIAYRNYAHFLQILNVILPLSLYLELISIPFYIAIFYLNNLLFNLVLVKIMRSLGGIVPIFKVDFTRDSMLVLICSIILALILWCMVLLQFDIKFVALVNLTILGFGLSGAIKNFITRF